MIERGSGRTSGLTDWQLMTVDNMWACLQDHDTANHWKQVAGWRKVCDLAQIHLGRLQEYRRGLAEAWPPETSAASGAYLAELDELIDKVRHTHDAAAANYTALSAATHAIGTTRAELRKVYEEYATKRQQKQAYDATVSDPKAVMGSRVTESPVTDAELERLNVQARGMMFNLSGELQQAQATLRQPPPRPRANPGIDQGDPDVYGGTSAAPVIPPIVSVPLPTSSETRSGSASKSVPAPTAPGLGPVLGGIGNAATPGLTNPGPPIGAAPPTTPGPTPGLGVPPFSRAAPARGNAPGAPHGQPYPLNQPGSATGANGNPNAKPRPLPPGGLIGGVPGMGLSQPGGGASPPRRINPVGGVIGGGGAGTGPTGGAGSRPRSGRGATAVHGLSPMGSGPIASSGAGVSPGGQSSLRPDGQETLSDDKRRWDPDQPWKVDEGVPPVVQQSDEEGPIDPGPAIGIDR
ncbi:hypothetical protein V6V47_19965 [Micromonospora sp. CPCC 205539]|uniref:hypothetical protein n=1 Tax=Micromonospora sp. CPCC 205539 TaxID=3122408 RepID=UPI002FF2893A